MEGGGLQCAFSLPLVFQKGHPADYKLMSSMQLRKFLTLAYRRHTGQDLPHDGSENPAPSWWPSDVTFKNDLKVSGSVSGMEYDRLPLVNLLQTMYDHFGLTFLLNLSSRLSKNYSDFRIAEDVSHNGSFLYVDSETLTYDDTDLATDNDTRLPLNPPKRCIEQRVNGKVKARATKKVRKPRFVCRHCFVDFPFHTFREEHQEVCAKNDTAIIARRSREYFLNALGLVDKSRPRAQTSQPKRIRVSKKAQELKRKLLALKEVRIIIHRCQANTKLSRVVPVKTSHLERMMTTALTRARVPLVNCLEIPELKQYIAKCKTPMNSM